jgi:hypothetical protein
MPHNTRGAEATYTLTAEEVARLLTLEARVASLWLVVGAIIRNGEPQPRHLVQGDRQ